MDNRSDMGSKKGRPKMSEGVEIKACPFCPLKMEPRNGGKFHQHPHSMCIVSDLILEHKVDYDLWNTRTPERKGSE